MVVGEFTQETDLVVIGGGPAGYSAAFRAAELGVPTVIVDARADGALGGVCLHEGCVPSKTLLNIAETVYTAEHAASFGIGFSKPKVDFAAVRAWKDKTIKTLTSGLESLARKHGVEVISGTAQFEDGRNITVHTEETPQRIRFKKALIATGAAFAPHPALMIDGAHILAPTQAMMLERLPQSLLIVGGDYMAVELAMIFAALGSQTTIACETATILPDVDGDLVRPLLKNLQRRLKELQLGAVVNSAAIKKDRIAVQFDGESAPPAKADFDQVIVCSPHALQHGNTRSLHLEKTQVKLDENQFIKIDEHMRTSDPRIFAAGDVTGPPLLADRALKQGRIAAEVIAGQDSAFDVRAIPHVIFSDPQIAWCGVMEGQARAEAVSHAIAKVPWGASGRAVGMGRSEGITKIIYDPESKIVLGVGLVGPHAGEMISEAALAIEMGATLTDLAETIHPHPTMSELLSDAARAAESTTETKKQSIKQPSRT